MTRTSLLRRIAPVAAVVLLAAVAPAAPAFAGTSEEDHVAAREALRRGEILPLARILAITARHVPGDVIDVELDREDGQWRYEVKVLTSTGRVREVKLNARDGAVLEIEDE
ncbi:PepSY domain-containing protein [Brevundimonas lenta]|uniref:Putative membrane protein YkoI n=1 Tax=Brevundimonas lenta TaxID=424796 RepID=A0A7W6JD65_9CAUL|nr:PepSY domain-containing protein [Brevundimonas lenta]MBB4081972.1 putative membrane protein YkoI [Brevundimonas lenta]